MYIDIYDMLHNLVKIVLKLGLRLDLENIR